MRQGVVQLAEKKHLNEEQQSAVQHENGPLLVIAGAGTGKTTVIVERIKRLLAMQGVSGQDILALTFTEKAAREMETRVDEALPLGYSQLEIGTFHSWGEQFLRNEAVHLGLAAGFRLMTEAESLLFVQKHWYKFPLTYFRPATNPTKYMEGLLRHFSRLRDEGITPQEYKLFVHKLEEKQEADTWTKKEWGELAAVYEVFQTTKEQEGVMDFADLVYYTWRILSERPQVRQRYQEKYKYILVDEYQDTNIAQCEIVRLLGGDEANITIVCDDDQAIYRFRGAAVSNVIQFRQTYPGSKVVVLTQNYRSTQAILDSAHRLVSHNNPDRLEVKEQITKKLRSQCSPGTAPIFFRSARVEDEAERVGKIIAEEKKRHKRAWKDFAILVRANTHAEPFINSLVQAGVPYQFLGPGKLFRRPEIKDLLAWLKLLDDPFDEVAFFRVASMACWNIPGRDLSFVRGTARRSGLSQLALIERLAKNETQMALSTDGRLGLERIAGLWQKQSEQLATKSAGQLLFDLLDETGIISNLVRPKNTSEQEAALNYGRFFDKIKAFENDPENRTWPALLTWINLKLEMGESPLAGDSDWSEIDAVNILTVHSAKGLEFPVVFLVNLSQGRFPTYQRKEQLPLPDALVKEILPSGDAHEQEERRLCYVGMTRAKEVLCLSSSKYYQEEAKREQKVSSFVTEALGEEWMSAPEQIPGAQIDWVDSWSTLAKHESKIPGSNPPVSYLSYSQMDCFDTCPLQYKYRYILSIPTPPTPPLIIGQAIHETLRDFYQKIRANAIKGEEADLVLLFEANWQKATFINQAEEKVARQAAKNRLIAFFANEIKGRTRPNIIGLEEPFKIKVGPTLIVGGRIDRIDELAGGQIEIIDYKVGQEKSQRDVDRDEQMTVYALAASRLHNAPFCRPADKLKLSFYYLESGVKVSTTRSEQQLQEAEEKILETAKVIQESQFPARPARPFPCDFCDYKLICEAWK